ncbi:MAG TPA: RagB/SusD family nutrient uptake outer membrane protein, partial [Sphingobacteriaceae bacterium]
FLYISLQQVSSCRKFVEVDPPNTSINAGNVYTTDATAAAVLTDIYAVMSSANSSNEGVTAITLFAGLSADDLTLFDLNNNRLASYYRNDLTAILDDHWGAFYKLIFTTNNALEGLDASTSLTPAVKQQLFGEAKFIRAFCFFYLVNLFGDVPLVLDLNYKNNALLPRAPKSQVYNQIVSDLKEAQQLLSANFLQGDALTPYDLGSEERVRPTRWSATALLARTYLYMGDYVQAELEANEIIDHTNLFNLESLDHTFLKNNREAIWQLQPVETGARANTGEGRIFVLPTDGPGGADYPVYLSDFVVQAFEPGDERKSHWIDSVVAGGSTYYYPYKYKVGNMPAPTTEYPTILRLAEIYLIRAEARSQLNNISGAQADIDMIRTRAGLPNTIATDQGSLLQAILHERRVELFTEWGHRWLDLKRTGALDAAMTEVTPIKGNTWEPFQALYPIPEREVINNPNMVQNPNY